MGAEVGNSDGVERITQYEEDRAILLSNANAFKVRSDIEKARGGGEDGLGNRKT